MFSKLTNLLLITSRYSNVKNNLVVPVTFLSVEKKVKTVKLTVAGMSMEPASPAYGAPPLPSTTSSYDPANTWDGNGPYSRVWTPTNGVEAQNLAYSYYSPGSNSNSYSPSSSSASSSSSVNSASSTNY